MVDLLFCDLRGRRRERRFRAGSQFEIDRFTDYELCARYRFGRESILFITNLVARDISRNTRRNHALHPLHQVLVALRFYASGSFLQVIGDTFGIDKSTVSRVINDVTQALISKTATLYQVAIDKRRMCHNKKRALHPRRVPLCNWMC